MRLQALVTHTGCLATNEVRVQSILRARARKFPLNNSLKRIQYSKHERTDTHIKDCKIPLPFDSSQKKKLNLDEKSCLSLCAVHMAVLLYIVCVWVCETKYAPNDERVRKKRKVICHWNNFYDTRRNESVVKTKVEDACTVFSNLVGCGAYKMAHF